MCLSNFQIIYCEMSYKLEIVGGINLSRFSKEVEQYFIKENTIKVYENI